MRATSSIRSTSRVTSSRRSAGTVTSRPSVGRRRLGRSRAPPGSPPGARAATGTPRIALHARLAQADHLRRRAAPADVDRARRDARAPHSSIIRRRRDGLRVHALLGRSPFSKRPEASLRRPRLHEVRWMFGPFQVATSSSTRVVSGRTSERAPPITPGDRGRARRRPRSPPSRRRACASARRASPPARPRARGAPSAAAPATRSRSNACSGWPVSSIA